MEPNVARLILDSLQLHTKSKEGEIDFGVTKGITKAGNTRTSALEDQIAFVNLHKNPSTMGRRGVGVISYGVSDAHACV